MDHKEETNENDRKYSVGHFRGWDPCASVGDSGAFILRIHSRHPRRHSVHEVCRPDPVAVRPGDRILRRGRKFSSELHLDHPVRVGTSQHGFFDRDYMVYYDFRDTFRTSVHQIRSTRDHALRRENCEEMSEIQNNDDPERDPIPAEQLEIMLFDVIHRKHKLDVFTSLRNPRSLNRNRSCRGSP